MKSVGIIAEYNPFHNGHLYHLKKVKELYPDHTILLVMNGHFTERGDVSIIDKWKKEYGFNIEMILYACETTVSSIGKASFKYADKILENWHKEGIKTREAFLRKENEFEKNKEKTQKSFKKEFEDKKVQDKNIRNLNRFVE